MGKRGPVPALIADEETLDTIKKLGGLQCTVEEVAAFLNMSVSNLYNRFKAEPELREAFDAGREVGKISLRRHQWKLAQTNAGMAIWLGKQYLGQTDKIDQTVRHELVEELEQFVKTIDATIIPDADERHH